MVCRYPTACISYHCEESEGAGTWPGGVVLTVEERQARNGDAQVDAMAQVCGLDLDARVCLAPNRRDAHHEGGEEDIVPEPVCGWGTVTVREVLTRHIDFMATPRRRFFQLLPFFCPGLLCCCRLCSCPCCLCFGKRVPTMNMSVCHRGALYMQTLACHMQGRGSCHVSTCISFALFPLPCCIVCCCR